MTVTIDASGLRDRVIEYGAKVADDAVQALLLDMSQNGPRSDEDHEHMVDLVEVTEADDTPPVIERHIHSPADYSSFVDEGTEPHEIRGNPLLAFYWPKTGKMMFLPSVQHPGTQRTGWWTDRIERWVEFVQQAVAS